MDMFSIKYRTNFLENNYRFTFSSSHFHFLKQMEQIEIIEAFENSHRSTLKIHSSNNITF